MSFWFAAFLALALGPSIFLLFRKAAPFPAGLVWAGLVVLVGWKAGAKP